MIPQIIILTCKNIEDITITLTCRENKIKINQTLTNVGLMVALATSCSDQLLFLVEISARKSQTHSLYFNFCYILLSFRNKYIFPKILI